MTYDEISLSIARKEYARLNSPLKYSTNGVYYKLSYRGHIYEQPVPFTRRDVLNICDHVDGSIDDLIQRFTNPVFIQVFNNQL